MKDSKPTTKENSTDLSGKQAFALTRENYKWVLIGLAFIVLGFVLMIGGGSDDPDVFSDKIFNFQRWTLAPMLVLAGYAIEIYAIMKKVKE